MWTALFHQDEELYYYHCHRQAHSLGWNADDWVDFQQKYPAQAQRLDEYSSHWAEHGAPTSPLPVIGVPLLEGGVATAAWLSATGNTAADQQEAACTARTGDGPTVVLDTLSGTAETQRVAERCIGARADFCRASDDTKGSPPDPVSRSTAPKSLDERSKTGSSCDDKQKPHGTEDFLCEAQPIEAFECSAGVCLDPPRHPAVFLDAALHSEAAFGSSEILASVVCACAVTGGVPPCRLLQRPVILEASLSTKAVAVTVDACREERTKLALFKS